MGLYIETGTGRTRYFDNIIDFLDATEDGFQGIIADNIGQEIDGAAQGVPNSEIPNDVLQHSEEIDHEVRKGMTWHKNHLERKRK